MMSFLLWRQIARVRKASSFSNLQERKYVAAIIGQSEVRFARNVLV